MKTTICLFLILFSGSFLCAQDSLRSQKSISLEEGFTHLVNKDLYRSPFVYKGFNPFVSLTAEKSSTNLINRISLGFSFGSMKTSFSPLASTNALNLDYTYLRKISSSKRYSFYAGPQVSALSWKADYFPEMEAPSYSKVRSYMLGVSLGLAAQFSYTISPRSTFTLVLSSPFCTYMYRPNFLDGSPAQSKLGIFTLWNPQVQLQYEYKASEKVSLYIQYRYQYLQYPYPKEIRMLGNGLSLGIKIRFR
jgi:hypothetical protein